MSIISRKFAKIWGPSDFFSRTVVTFDTSIKNCDIVETVCLRASTRICICQITHPTLRRYGLAQYCLSKSKYEEYTNDREQVICSKFEIWPIFLKLPGLFGIIVGLQSSLYFYLIPLLSGLTLTYVSSIYRPEGWRINLSSRVTWKMSFSTVRQGDFGHFSRVFYLVSANIYGQCRNKFEISNTSPLLVHARLHYELNRIRPLMGRFVGLTWKSHMWGDFGHLRGTNEPCLYATLERRDSSRIS